MKHLCLLTGCAALLLGLCLAPAAPASAFCVYNRTDETIRVQESGSDFSLKVFNKVIHPGGYACCNWKNKDCNKQGDRTSPLNFIVSKYHAIGAPYCGDVTVKAGGWMDVYKDSPGFRCTAYFE